MRYKPFWPITQLAVLCGFSLSMAFLATPSSAWDGTNSETGDCVEINEGNLVRTGEEIEVYDCSSGSYRYLEIEDIDASGYGVEIEAYDSETGDYIYLEMDE
jgi:hypothetical protein